MNSVEGKSRKASAGFTNGTGKGFTNGSGKGFTNGAGRGFTNGTGKGMTNGLGRTNGLTNGSGRGMTNGLGRTNGMTNGVGRTNGMTNGMGRTNGLTNGSSGFTNGMGGRLNDQGSVHPKRLSAILIVILVMLVPISLALLATPQGVPGKLVTIDGKFKDWNKMNEYLDASMCGDAPLDISSFSIAFDESDFYFRFNVQGALLSRATVDRYFAFLDSDANAATGYSFGGIGADYAVEAFGSSAGWGVQTAKFAGADQSNWSAFATIGGGHAESVGTEAEVQGVLDAKLAVGDVRVRMATMSGSDIADVCAPTVDGVHGALVVRQAALDSAGIISSTSLMTHTLIATGGDVAYSGITVAATSVAVSQPVGSSVADSGSATIPVIATSAPANATFVKAAVSSVAMTTGTCAIIGSGLAAYYAEAPTTIAVDGAFADWNGVAKTSDTVGDVSNSNIDIIEEAAATQAASLFAYVKFGGTPMAGMTIPSTRTISSGGSGGGGGSGVSALPKVNGEDVCRIYIDSAVGGSSIGGIQADYMMELRGKNGVVTSKRLLAWPGLASLGTISAEAGASAMEAGVPFASIGSPTGTVQMFVETTDWERNADSASATTTLIAMLGTRSAAEDNGIDMTLGTPSVFENQYARYISAVYDSTHSAVVIAYQRWTSPYYGYAVVATILGDTISYGTPVLFNSDDTRWVSTTFDAYNGRVVIAYASSTTSGSVIPGTVSGNNIAFGTPTQFNDAQTMETALAYDSTNHKFVLAYSDYGHGNPRAWGYAAVGTVIPGTPDTITLGTAMSCYNDPDGSTEFIDTKLNTVVYDSNNQRIVLGYVGESTYPYFRVCTVNVGATPDLDTISLGTPAPESVIVFSLCMVWDDYNDKVVVAYVDVPGYNGYAMVGTVTLSPDTVGFGTAVQYSTEAYQYVAMTSDTSRHQVGFAFQSYDSSNGQYTLGTVSGTSISFANPITFSTVAVSHVSCAYDSAHDRVLIAYCDDGDNYYGNGVTVNDTPEFPSVAIPIIFCAIPLLAYRAKRRRD